MKFNKQIKNILIILVSTLALSACSTAKKSSGTSGDVYTGTDTVQYLATGVKDRVFFATNRSALTTSLTNPRIRLTMLPTAKMAAARTTPVSWRKCRDSDWVAGCVPLVSGNRTPFIHRCGRILAYGHTSSKPAVIRSSCVNHTLPQL